MLCRVTFGRPPEPVVHHIPAPSIADAEEWARRSADLDPSLPRTWKVNEVDDTSDMVRDAAAAVEETPAPKKEKKVRQKLVKAIARPPAAEVPPTNA